MSHDEHDGDSTSPDLGEDLTNPGSGPNDVFLSIAASLNRAVGAVRSLAEACAGLRSEGRRRALWHLALALGELGDLAHDTRRAILQLIREEQGE